MGVADNPAGLLYATYLGGSSIDEGYAISVDEAGCAYVTGETSSSGFPTTAGAYDPTRNGTDAFVAKVNPSGTGLAYATFLGGSQSEYSLGIDVDDLGHAYVTGYTSSSDFPATSGADDRIYGGGWDAFVAKLNPAGSALVYATYLGGGSGDFGHGIAVDAEGYAYVAGETTSVSFPTIVGAYDPVYNQGSDAFVTKLKPDGSRLMYSTFLGGGSDDYGYRVAVDASGCAYVVGDTDSADFPTTAGAYDRTFNGGSWDAFVVKLNANGGGLAYATYLGTAGTDSGNYIAIDGSGRAYLVGSTNSTDFPVTTLAYDRTHNGGSYDVFVARLKPAGNNLDYATYLGGGEADYGVSISVDEAGRAYVAGLTDSTDFPTTVSAYDRSYNGGYEDIFLARLNVGGSLLEYSTYLGGSGGDYGSYISIDGSNRAYVTGNTSSDDFPTTAGAYDGTYHGGSDAFVAKLSLEAVPTPTSTWTPTSTHTPTVTQTPTRTATLSPTVYVPPTPIPYVDTAMGVLPLLTKHEPQNPLPLHDAGAATTLLSVQNVAGQADDFAWHFLGQGGHVELVQSHMGVQPYAPVILSNQSLPAPAGWIGSAALDGNHSAPPAGVVRMTWNSGLTGTPALDTTGAAYSSPRSGTTLYFPYATVKPLRDASGRHGRFSTLTLMNTGQDVAAFEIALIGSSDVQVADTLRINESVSYNLADPNDLVGSQLGSDWQGAIKVTSTGEGQPLAGVVTTHWADQSWSQWASAYEGVVEGVTTLYAPQIMRKDRSGDPAVGTWVSSSNLLVQNLGEADASVRVSWYGAGTSTQVFTAEVSIGPGEGREFHTRYPQGAELSGLAAALGNLFQGTATVESLNDQPLAAVVHSFYHQSSENWVTTYVASEALWGAQYLPYVSRVTGWEEWSAISFQNLSDDTATVGLAFYRPGSAEPVYEYDSLLLAARGVAMLNTRFSPIIPVTSLGDDFRGSMRVTSDRPLAVVAALYGNPAWGASYSAVVE